MKANKLLLSYGVSAFLMAAISSPALAQCESPECAVNASTSAHTEEIGSVALSRISTPDRVKTSIGTLKYIVGVQVKLNS